MGLAGCGSAGCGPHAAARRAAAAGCGLAGCGGGRVRAMGASARCRPVHRLRIIGASGVHRVQC
ncbi:hypothetical protein E4A49_06400 [Micrococcus lylae]|uniref:Lipoprotein n=1 Tax=Micrococcus lylae TaxID=1273 RepID=A0ABY2JZI3_9MICC|nr:hypothetical protein E4A49_06400 [Micrococcus lylae]